MSPLGSPRKEFSPPHCPICNEPIDVATTKTDGNGNAIHEECNASKVSFEQAGPKQRHSTRPWMVVADEVTREHDPGRMIELVGELNEALDEQELDGTPKPGPDGKPKPHK